MCARPSNYKPSTSPEIPCPDLSECLAKTRNTPDGVEKGCTVETHLRAACEVGKELLWYFRRYRSGELLDDHDLIAPLTHDIGKISPAFQDKIGEACGRARFGISPEGKKDENHCVTSSLVLGARLGLENLAWTAASHHGSCCRASYSLKVGWLGGEPWEARREELIRKLCERYSIKLEDISSEDWKKQLVLGFTILSDWIASGIDFAYGEEPTPEVCANAVRQAGFLPFEMREGLAFGDVFQTNGKPWVANPLQREMAENVRPGAVYVLEMEMGSGKTEAALYLAYKLLAEHRHNGLYFALPTCLTSDKIYERVIPYLKSVLSPETPAPSAKRLHGKAWLHKALAQGGENGFETKKSEVDDWFDVRKRGLLAPFAVGTADQLLMSVIHVRHSALRALGAAGKVVILDEVHSYDAYTGTLIKNLVESLRKWGCTVIILSATLTHKLRRDLLGVSEEPESSAAYPLLSIRDGENVTYHTLSAPEPEKVVQFRHTSRIEDSLQSALEHARRGECVLWVENTVAEAQKVFRQLALRKPSDVPLGLIHSQFQEHSRSQNEGQWVKLYGKDASPQQREGGKILVGTQVLEQSVDIDADYLITRLCPVDMLLQRIGRLWRHRTLDALRPAGAECCAEVLNEAPFSNHSNFSKHEKTPPVYAPYVLARTQEVLEPLREISIPRDIRTLIESTYADRDETDYYAYLKADLKENREKLERFANLSSGNALAVQPDTEASTRYTEEETVDVLLLEDYQESERLLKPFGSPLWFRIPDRTASKEKRTQCAAVLSSFLVRVRISRAPQYAEFPLDFLSHILYIGREQNRPLRAAFVGPQGKLQSLSRLPAQSENGENIIRYDKELGYSCEKKGTVR